LQFLNNFIAKIILSVFFVGSVAALASAQTTTGSTTARIDHLYRAQSSTGEVIYDTLQGVTLKSAVTLPSSRPAQWRLIGAIGGATANKLVYFDSSRGALAVSFYG